MNVTLVNDKFTNLGLRMTDFYSLNQSIMTIEVPSHLTSFDLRLT